jgi:hypothetical protein
MGSVIFMLTAVFGQLLVFGAGYMLCRQCLVHEYRMRALKYPTKTFAELTARFNRLPSRAKMIWALNKFDWDEYLNGSDAS